MNEVVSLCGAKPGEIIRNFVDKRTPAIMSYSSKHKWHVAKVLLTALAADKFEIELLPRKNPRPINIQIGQSVGVSIKYGAGKFIFGSTVLDFESATTQTSGGEMVLEVPEQIELVQRRSYFRVNAPESLKLKVILWHRCGADNNDQAPPDKHWQGSIVDISAAGSQVAIDAALKPDFKKGQFIRLRFTPMPDESPLTLNAQIRNILPTADEKSICLGLQMVGLEASAEGRLVLRRLCGVVEQYYQINQSCTR